MKRTAFLLAVASILGAITFLPNSTRAASAAEIDQSARAAFNSLYASSPTGQTVGKQAKAVTKKVFTRQQEVFAAIGTPRIAWLFLHGNLGGL